MKASFRVGVVLLVLGIMSLFIPIPRRESRAVRAGDLAIGVEVDRQDRVPPIVSAVLILAGAGVMLTAMSRR